MKEKFCYLIIGILLATTFFLASGFQKVNSTNMFGMRFEGDLDLNIPEYWIFRDGAGDLHKLTLSSGVVERVTNLADKSGK